MNDGPVFDSNKADALRSMLSRQQLADKASRIPSVAARKADLNQLLALVVENKEAIIAAIQADYGCRSYHETLYAEIITVIDGLQHTIKQLSRWAEPQRRGVKRLLYLGSSNRLIPQPRGCVGIITPWNFPMALSFGPLACALAAGNRAMVKMSGNSRTLTRLLKTLSPQYLPEDKLLFVEDSGGVGRAFSKLPFDLLLFTGSTETGKSVMQSASQNLTPVVLELGGKCPAYIDKDFPLETAVQRLLYIKHFNAGQICVNVDYVFVHKSQQQAFIEQAKVWASQHLANLNSPDYTALIDQPAYERMIATLDDAASKGAQLVNLHGAQQPDAAARKVPMHLVLDTTEDMVIRQRETFGPLLMVLTYDDDSDVVKYLQERDAPLAFYPFSNSRKKLDYLISNTRSGGVTVNDASFHIVQHDLPFGGVGASGMGHYHGKEGFETFSKMRPIHQQARWPLAKLLQPPYGHFASRMYALTFKWMSWGVKSKPNLGTAEHGLKKLSSKP